MEKSDLKTGMLVETRDGRYMLVMRDTPEGDNFVQPSLKGLHTEEDEKVTWKPFNMYNDDLLANPRKHQSPHRNDIVKVYGYSSNMRGAQISIGKGMNTRKLLWERPKSKQFVFVSTQTYKGETGEDVADTEGVLFEPLTIDEAIRTLQKIKP